MPIDDKKYKRLTAKNVGRAPRGPGVYALYDGDKRLIFLGHASGKDSIRGKLRTHLGAESKEATRYKREPCRAPSARLKDLLREHTRAFGSPPRLNA
jgi:hypothetical protein